MAGPLALASGVLSLAAAGVGQDGYTSSFPVQHREARDLMRRSALDWRQARRARRPAVARRALRLAVYFHHIARQCEQLATRHSCAKTNGRTERCGRPSVPELPIEVARPHSL